MKATMTALIAVLTIGLVGLVAGNASACGGHGGGYGGSFNWGSSSYHNDYHKVYVKKVYVEPVVVRPCINPLHSLVLVNPGDSWFSICLREYGNPSVWNKVVIFNGLPLNARLAAGMQLRLPVIHPDGGMSPSLAPAAIVLGGPAPTILPQGNPIPQANFVPQVGGGLPQASGMPRSMAACRKARR